jgi:hypothetical protein
MPEGCWASRKPRTSHFWPDAEGWWGMMKGRFWKKQSIWKGGNLGNLRSMASPSLVRDGDKITGKTNNLLPGSPKVPSVESRDWTFWGTTVQPDFLSPPSAWFVGHLLGPTECLRMPEWQPVIGYRCTGEISVPSIGLSLLSEMHEAYGSHGSHSGHGKEQVGWKVGGV